RRAHAAARYRKPGAWLGHPAGIDLWGDWNEAELRRAEPIWRHRSIAELQSSRLAERHADRRLGDRAPHRGSCRRRAGLRSPRWQGDFADRAQTLPAGTAIYRRLGAYRRDLQSGFRGLSARAGLLRRRTPRTTRIRGTCSLRGCDNAGAGVLLRRNAVGGTLAVPYLARNAAAGSERADDRLHHTCRSDDGGRLSSRVAAARGITRAPPRAQRQSGRLHNACAYRSRAAGPAARRHAVVQRRLVGDWRPQLQ